MDRQLISQAIYFGNNNKRYKCGILDITYHGYYLRIIYLLDFREMRRTYFAMLTLLLLLVSLEQTFCTQQSMILKDQNTRDHSRLTIGNGDTMQGVCIPHSILAHGNSKGEARGKNRHKNKNNAKVVRNLKERNVRSKGKSPKQDLTSANDICYAYNSYILT